jgi:tetratricopeptide (TPR) repeat protein
MPDSATATSERLTKLQQMLEKQPNDTFLLYAIALEHKKLNQPIKAIEYLNRVIAIDPGYCYAYHQRGLIHESTGDAEAAKKAYREGIEAATKKGDAHARDEIRAALEMIE